MKKIPISFAAFCLLLSSCSNSETASLKKEAWGNVNGQEVHLYTLTNASGAYVKISNFGGVVQAIGVPDSKGEIADVALGFDTPQGYINYGPYFGTLIGRYGNRIAKGKFTLNGNEYTLATNNGVNHLHGGPTGFHDRIWKIEQIPAEKGNTALKLTYTSADGEEGYPGTLKVAVVYTWTKDNQLKIEYEAETDKPTVLNLTNHSYFNLSGGKDKTILGEIMTIHASRYTAVDETLIPTGELPEVAGTMMDFTSPKAIGRDIGELGGGLDGVHGGGYDHNFVLRDKPGELITAAFVYNPVSGRTLETLTTEPGIQFYTGNFLDGSFEGKGVVIGKHVGYCLETQHFPDSPNHPSFPSTTLLPGQKFQSTTIYKFGVRK